MSSNTSDAIAHLSDGELLTNVEAAVRDERIATARLTGLLIEIDRRRLYLREGYSSLFTYCTQKLHLSEHAAYNRIETARATRRFPIILAHVESAAVTLTTVRLLAPHLTDTNHRDVLERARHRSKREVELLVATLNPRPDVPSIVRKLPVHAATKTPLPQVPGADAADHPAAVAVVATAPPVAPVSRPAEVKPLAPERYKIQFTVGLETYQQLRRAQDLLRHLVPSGDPTIIFERALRLLLENLEGRKLGKTAHPRAARKQNSKGRYIPAAIKRTVWRRDSGRCAFNGAHGRCTETGLLEFHHLVPFASGGETSASNLELRCRAHNQHEAVLWFGPGQQPLARE